MTRVVGVDPKPGAYVAVELVDGRLKSLSLQRGLGELVAFVEGADAVALGAPLGHDDPDGKRSGGVRAADEAARVLLGPNAGSVPLTPPLDLFGLDGLDRAGREAAKRGVPAPSQRAWRIAHRIVELHREAAQQETWVECHPEVSFQMVLATTDAGDAQASRHLEHRRRSWRGLHERLTLLHGVGLRPARSTGGIGRSDPNDVLEATVAAWTAMRVAGGEAMTLPEDKVPTDPATGRPVAIHR